jgi:hypothetical protein
VLAQCAVSKSELTRIIHDIHDAARS